MSQFIHRERRSSPYSSAGFRSVTNRQGASPMQVQTQDEENLTEIPAPKEEPSIQQNSQPKPFKFKKSELLPPDPTAPIFIQFSKIVKRASNLILRGIGTNRKELKPVVNDAFDMFYKDFDTWWKSQKRVSQRKDSSNPDIEILKKQLNECNSSIQPLRDQCHLWKSYRGYCEIYAPPFEYQQITIPPIEKSDEVKDELKEFVKGLVSLSKSIQKVNISCNDANNCINEVRRLVQFDIRIDNKKQLDLLKQLSDDESP